MNATALYPRLAAGLMAAGLLALPCGALAAQQRPITGQMMDGRDPAPVAVPAAPAPAHTMPLRETAAPAAPAPVAEPAAASAPDAADAPAFRARQVGDTTRYLLQLQADDSRPGARLPMLGDEASASYDRYLKSFTHPIPEFFEPSVGTGSGGNGSNGGR